MLQLRSILNVADNTGAKKAAAIGALGKNQRYAKIGDVLKVHIKEAAPDGSVKKGMLSTPSWCAPGNLFIVLMALYCALTPTPLSSSTKTKTRKYAYLRPCGS